MLSSPLPVADAVTVKFSSPRSPVSSLEGVDTSAVTVQNTYVYVQASYEKRALGRSSGCCNTEVLCIIEGNTGTKAAAGATMHTATTGCSHLRQSISQALYRATGTTQTALQKGPTSTR